jgi:hypothetical protein
MEASSLTFGGRDGVPAATSTAKERPQPARGAAGPAKPALSLPVTLPLRFIVTGLCSLLAGMILLAALPELLATYHYNQRIVAVTHIFTLGWIGSVIMGAMYQLVPVTLETTLHNTRMPRWHFWLHSTGFVGMVAMFWVWDMKQAGHFGSAVALGIGLFVYNLGRTIHRARRWNVVTLGIAASLAWLSLAMLAGLYVASAKCWNFSPFDPMAQMHAHAHLGGVGFFLLITMSVSYKLVPMFALSEVRNPRRAAGSLILVNAGLAGLFVTMLGRLSWEPVFAFVIVCGIALYGWELLAILRTRKRRPIDWAMIHFLTGLALLAPLSVLGFFLSWPRPQLTERLGQLENLYGFVAFAGVFSLVIIGMIYKIVPFLVWYARYGDQLGRTKVPALADMYSVKLQKAGYWLFAAGFLPAGIGTALGSAVMIRWSCSLLALGVVVFIVNVAKVISHMRRPVPAPAGAIGNPARRF